MIIWGGDNQADAALNTGGRYCAATCAAPILFYQDADADGFGIPTVTVSACAQPPGYASNNLDCDDTNPSVHPNALEINDGKDNQCPGEAGYGTIDEISGVSGFWTLGDKAAFSWDAQGGATSYDVVRSTTRDFSSECAVFSSSQLFIIDGEMPSIAGGFYYLVRPSAPHVGSWGQNSDGTPRAVSCLVTAASAGRK
jgi:hypothetical protein